MHLVQDSGSSQSHQDRNNDADVQNNIRLRLFWIEAGWSFRHKFGLHRIRKAAFDWCRIELSVKKGFIETRLPEAIVFCWIRRQSRGCTNLCSYLIVIECSIGRNFALDIFLISFGHFQYRGQHSLGCGSWLQSFDGTGLLKWKGIGRRQK